MELLTNFKALVLVVFFFGASIFVHELGHFLAARWRGLKVTRFSIGFGPKLFGWTRDGVEYIVAALPIGGYVALPQLGHMEIIEGKAEPTKLSEISWTSKVIVLVAGAFFNVLFALFLGSILFLLGGYPDRKSNNSTVIGDIPEVMHLSAEETVPNPAFEAGLKVGDEILAIDGEHIHRWNDVSTKVILGAGRTQTGEPLSTFTVERNGQKLDIPVSPIVGGPDKIRNVWVSAASPAIIGATFENSPAEKAGLKPKDRIVELNGEPLISLHQITRYVEKHKGQPMEITIARGDDRLKKTVQPVEVITNEQGDKSLMIGIAWAFETEYVKETPLAQIASSVRLTWDTLEKLFHPKSNINLSHLSGVVGMGRMIYYSAQADIRFVLWIVVIINVNLAILNLLPIPVLDGGHILFASIERIRKRPLPQNFMVSVQSVFVLILLSLMIYVTYHDILRTIRDIVQKPEPRFEIQFPE
ncbi:MAG: RIP metalloprotease RseP [Verrucomicrobiae bacterium]|nr:RIP metalloprotease RseP [Verrucomicrobiae bacterium]